MEWTSYDRTIGIALLRFGFIGEQLIGDIDSSLIGGVEMTSSVFSTLSLSYLLSIEAYSYNLHLL